MAGRENPFKTDDWSTTLKSLGILGGTFNPIHIGHLIAAQEAMCAYNLDRVVFIPNRTPPHRLSEPGIINPDERYEMVVRAISSNPRFFASSIEIDRAEVSYTYETVKELGRIYPGTELYFIAGLDSLLEYKWKNFEELLDNLHLFICVTRPGFYREDLEEKLGTLSGGRKNKMAFLEIPDVHISSTLVRKRIQEEKNIKYLVPEEVESFIACKSLYKCVCC
jgi:nicotinate-nucleotide adenylyltransferase